MRKIDQKGFHQTIVLVVVAVVVIIGLVGYKVATNKNTTSNTKTETTTSTSQTTQSSSPTTTSTSETLNQLIWMQSGNGWQVSEGKTAPVCPAQPILKSPVDTSKVTSILYPGQTRGSNYKPHGGFRFDNQSNNQTITAPLDGYVVRGSSYKEMGEVQYLFDIINNCGIMYRFDHLRVISETLMKIADTWPAPQDSSSQTHTVSPAVSVKQGDILATSIGFVSTKNSTVDWGVYDFRSTNEASKSTAYQQAHTQDKELSWHAACWFDWLPASDAAKIKSLPAGDSKSGKTSDYCK